MHCPPQRNDPTNKVRRFVFFVKLVLALATDRTIYSVDETGVNFCQTRRHHWSPAQDPWLVVPYAGRTVNISCIFAVTQSQAVQSQYIKGACDAAIYARFIYNLVEADPQFSHSDHSRRPLILADNVSFHKTALLENWLRSRNVEYLMTPTYSPMVNGVEFINQRLKAKLRTVNIDNNEHLAALSNELLFDKLGQKDYKACFRRVLSYGQDILECRDILE